MLVQLLNESWQENALDTLKVILINPYITLFNLYVSIRSYSMQEIVEEEKARGRYLSAPLSGLLLLIHLL